MNRTLSKKVISPSKKSHNATSFSQSLARKILFHLLKQINNGTLTVVDHDQKYCFGLQTSNAHAVINVHHQSVYSDILKRGDIALGEAFANKTITSPCILTVIRLLCQQQNLFKKLAKINFFTGHLSERLSHYLRKNNLVGSKKNIMAHYDLGNDFFSTFLDSTMMYSSAIYKAQNQPLEEASNNKLKTICDTLALSDRDHLIEIGSGWGGLAIYAAQNYGCKVTTTTISEAQYQHAKSQVKKHNLTHLITVLDKDYRLLKGQFDKLVSIEMIEAVGHQFLPSYVKQINTLLKPNGKALVQAILLPDQKYDSAKYHVDFIKAHIFPGGFLPSISEVLSKTKKHTALNLVNYLDITESYALTLKDWREQFNAQKSTLDSKKYDDFFCRMWDFYLAYCEGGFRERVIYCGQLLFEKNKSIQRI